MKSVKHSKKRVEIYNVLKATKSHPSAVWIYTMAKQKIPDLSLATVYRNLAFFCEQGDAICIATVNGQERYDANTEPHTHFICDVCGGIIDIQELAFSAFSFETLEESYGVEIKSHSLTFNGKCASCKASKVTQ